MRRRTRALAAALTPLLLAPVLTVAAHAEHLVPRGIEGACPEGAVPEGRYDDVPRSDPFATAVDCVSEYDLLSGLTSTQFGPAREVTRRQLAQVLHRFAAETGASADLTDPGFIDDDGLTGEARDAVWSLTNAGVLRGVGGGRFSPDTPVRRDQLATALLGVIRIAGLRGFPTGGDAFTDDDGSVHEAAIDALAAEGITIGQGDHGRYGPGALVLRQQLALLLARLVDVAVEQSVLDGPYWDGAYTFRVDQQGQDLTPGDPLTGEIAWGFVDRGASAEVAGACVDAGPVEDRDTSPESVLFSVPTREDAAPGTCEATFTLTFSNGRTERFGATVTIARKP